MQRDDFINAGPRPGAGCKPGQPATLLKDKRNQPPHTIGGGFGTALALKGAGSPAGFTF